MRTGGQILVDQLELNGTDLAFCSPGRELPPRARRALRLPDPAGPCRHELGRPTPPRPMGSSPGGPASASSRAGPARRRLRSASTPQGRTRRRMLLLVGQVPRAFRGREALQEIDYAHDVRRHREGGVGDRQRRADSRAHGTRLRTRALRAARARRARPTRGRARGEADATDGGSRRDRATPLRADDLGLFGELLAAAERPLVVVGEGGWTRADRRGRARVLRGERPPGRLRLPLPGLRRQPLALLHRRARRRDGRAARDASRRRGSRRRDRRPAGRGSDERYTLLVSPRPRRSSSTSIPTRRSSPRSTSPIWRSSPRCPRSPPRCVTRCDRAALARLARGGARRLRGEPPARADGGTGGSRRDHGLSPARLPADAIQTCGAGNYTVWAHRFAEFTQYGTQVCPRSGSMGYGVAAAISSKLVHPNRVVLCFTGDGDFVMSSPELATAVQYELPIVILLVTTACTRRSACTKSASTRDGLAAPTS